MELTDGVAAIAPWKVTAQRHLFSARYACPSCGHSIDELEPRLFSFNNPAGACSGCDGLGVTQFFDESRVVLHPEASLAEGAIRGWDRRNVYYFHLLRSLSNTTTSIWRSLSTSSRKSIATLFCTAVTVKKLNSRMSMTVARCSNADMF